MCVSKEEKIHGTKNAPPGSGRLSGRFHDNLQILLYKLQNPWHGCLPVSDKKNFWIERHVDHHGPLLVQVESMAASEKRLVQQRGVDHSKKGIKHKVIIFLSNLHFNIFVERP
jgi:hypothetical protein